MVFSCDSHACIHWDWTVNNNPHRGSLSTPLLSISFLLAVGTLSEGLHEFPTFYEQRSPCCASISLLPSLNHSRAETWVHNISHCRIYLHVRLPPSTHVISHTTAEAHVHHNKDSIIRTSVRRTPVPLQCRCFSHKKNVKKICIACFRFRV